MTTHAVGFCASIATVILMAGNKVAVDDNCFCLIHLPWSVVQGNANDLEKEIDALDKCKKAMLSYYMRHARVPVEEIEKCLENETWLLGEEFAELFAVDILECDQVLNIAAKFDLSKYKNVPKRILDMENLSTNDDTHEKTTKVGDTVEDTTSSSEVTEDIATEEEVTVPLDEKNTENVPTTKEEEEEHIPLDEIDPETTQDIEGLRELLFRAYEMIGELEDDNQEKTDENQSIFNKLKAARKENDELKEKLVDKIVDDSDKAEMVSKAECEKRVSGM